jgi:hypothetical protein
MDTRSLKFSGNIDREKKTGDKNIIAVMSGPINWDISLKYTPSEASIQEKPIAKNTGGIMIANAKGNVI